MIAGGISHRMSIYIHGAQTKQNRAVFSVRQKVMIKAIDALTLVCRGKNYPQNFKWHKGLRNTST